MAHIGLLPTDIRVKEMTDLQWLVMARCLDDEEYRKAKNNFETWCQTLGLTSENGYVPLSFFINHEMADKLFKSIEEDQDRDSQILSEEESEKLESIAQMDIDGMLTDEDREKLRQQELEAHRQKLELAGVKIGDESTTHD